MIRICYSASEGCEISGLPAELRAVAVAISRLSTAQVGPVIVDADLGFTPHPYERALNRLVLSSGSGRVRAYVRESELCIEGSADSLAALAPFFDIPDDVSNGFHVHHEYYDGSSYVAPDSIPLVICASLPHASNVA